MRKFASALICCLCAAALTLSLAACGSSEQQDETQDQQESSAQSSTQSEESAQLQGAEVGEDGYIDTASEEYATGTWVATVSVAGYDSFDIQLDAASAPVTVSNFCNLAENGYYDGLAFYRVVEGFCLQGGSAGNTAASGNDGLAPILGEFSANDVDNALADAFEKGTVAMARTNDPNSATSTFFITLGSDETVAASLDGMYAAFGTIDAAGMEVVDQIVADCAASADADMGIIEDEADMPIIESITISNGE